MPHLPVRRRLLGAAAAASLAPLVAPSSGRAQAAWPVKPVRVIVAFPAGGLTDALARAHCDQLAQRLGQPFTVENKAGASGMIGTGEVARAAPDGYTFLFTISTTINQNRVLYKKMPYDPDRDFAYVSGFDAGHLPLAVNAGSPIRTAREFVELARRERVTLGNYSAGSFPHMVAQQLNKNHGAKVEPVHYKGEAPMWVDLASGQITGAIGSISALLPHLQAGKIRVIAVPTLTRSPRLPDVPTFDEQGFKDEVFRIQGWIGMFAPAKTPREIIARVSQLIQEGAGSERIRAINANFGLREKPWTAEEFERLNREIGPVWNNMARELGVSLD
ncbi:MAG: tripartite tricarboxylate transporter substrate binding protein [Burkholderiales bacterium]|nr:tripartite tricarboxylate transporter substrate binding protein [Burkholderiales bacterium]